MPGKFVSLGILNIESHVPSLNISRFYIQAKTHPCYLVVMEGIDTLRDWDDRTFWTEVQHAFAASQESDELRAEKELWDSTLSDGFRAALDQN